jgi:hypothetical protein
LTTWSTTIRAISCLRAVGGDWSKDFDWNIDINFMIDYLPRDTLFEGCGGERWKNIKKNHIE